MTSAAYLAGRKKYARPQGMLWADNPGTLSGGVYYPTGLEVGASFVEGQAENQFLILSDDNRDSFEFQTERIEKRERMINGRMRSHHIADKLKISVQWNMLPSRSFALRPDFDEDGNSSLTMGSGKYTTDGGAGGSDMLDWYNNHQGPFWVYLAYDNKNVFGDNDSSYAHMSQYNQVIEMYLADFKYSVQKRGANTHDFWNVSLVLEEV